MSAVRIVNSVQLSMLAGKWLYMLGDQWTETQGGKRLTVNERSFKGFRYGEMVSVEWGSIRWSNGDVISVRLAI